MKVCIFGAGAIGSHLAVRLAAAQAADVSVVARGPHLQAIRERGLTLRTKEHETNVRIAAATDNAASLPPQDLVIVTLKAHSIPAAAGGIARLIAPGGCALFFVNGIPWWWRHGTASPGPLLLLDPKHALWTKVGGGRALGGVVSSANSVREPGVVTHLGFDDWAIGEPDNSASERVARAVALLKGAGLNAKVSTDIRRDIWIKLLSNATGNTLGALTRMDSFQLSNDAELHAIKLKIADEILAVAKHLGWDLRDQVNWSAAIAGSGTPGLYASMVQDVMANRPMEVEALLGQVQAFAREASVPTPVIDIITALSRGLNRTLKG